MATPALMFPSGEPAALEELWSKLAPGGFVAVQLDEDTAWHHRLLLGLARFGHHAVLDPDGHVHVECVSAVGEGSSPTRSQVVNNGRRPRRPTRSSPGEVHRSRKVRSASCSEPGKQDDRSQLTTVAL